MSNRYLNKKNSLRSFFIRKKKFTIARISQNIRYWIFSHNKISKDIPNDKIPEKHCQRTEVNTRSYKHHRKRKPFLLLDTRNEDLTQRRFPAVTVSSTILSISVDTIPLRETRISEKTLNGSLFAQRVSNLTRPIHRYPQGFECTQVLIQLPVYRIASINLQWSQIEGFPFAKPIEKWIDSKRIHSLSLNYFFSRF